MNRLKSLRKKFKYSQNDLAKRLGVTTAAVSQWERGLTFPSVDLLLRLAELFGTSIEYVLGADDQAECVSFPIIGEVAAGFSGAEAREVHTGSEC